VNAKGTGIKLSGEWLNVSQFHPINPMPTPGELVEVTLERSDRGAWINSLKIIGTAAGPASPTSSDRDRQIRRQVAMKCAATITAAALQSNAEARADHVFPLADRLLAWLEKED
jgi:hypothetical protein